MLARAVPGAMVLVCEQRAIAARARRPSASAPPCIVLDDGFQHRQFARDVDIVLVTPGDLRDRRVPFGRLRESVVSARRARTPSCVDGDSAAMPAVERAAPARAVLHVVATPRRRDAARSEAHMASRPDARGRRRRHRAAGTLCCERSGRRAGPSRVRSSFQITIATIAATSTG